MSWASPSGRLRTSGPTPGPGSAAGCGRGESPASRIFCRVRARNTHCLVSPLWCEGPAMTERELFIAALRLPEGDARAAFLEGACADERLRQQVESMLRDHEQLGSFLESPASPPAATADDRRVSDGPGAVIG